MRRGRHDPAGGVCCATPRNARRLAARWRAVCVRHFGLIPRPLVVCIPASGRALACSLSNVVRPRAQTMQACSDAAGSSTRRRSEAAPGDAARRRTQQAAPGVVVSSTRCRSDAARRRSRAGVRASVGRVPQSPRARRRRPEWPACRAGLRRAAKEARAACCVCVRAIYECEEKVAGRMLIFYRVRVCLVSACAPK